MERQYSLAECVLRDALEKQASQRPDAVFAHFPRDGQWTFADTLQIAQSSAYCFQSLGVTKGTRVLLLLPNGKCLLQSWFGINYLGAVQVPCNTAWKGAMLQNALDLSQPQVAVVHKELISCLAEIECPSLEHVIVVGGSVPGNAIPGVEIHPESLLSDPHDGELSRPDIASWDCMQMLFTSGTTGTSKGVICSYQHAASFILQSLPDHFGIETNFLCVLPLFHAGGLNSVYTQLVNGGSVVIPERFSGGEFWQTVRDYDVSSSTLLGAMVPFLLSMEATEFDKDHCLKSIGLSPLNQDAVVFGERFGVRVWTSYGATEMGVTLSCIATDERLGATGYVVEGIEAKLVDENDIEVPCDATGELVVRSSESWRFFNGYHNNDKATLKAMRNGWYHSGDLMTRDENDLYRFKGRLNDAIRRRGENISPLDVEAAVLTFEGVVEVVAYAVPSELSEDEVMIALAGSDIDFTVLVEYLIERMPHYMVPRYVRLLAELPRNEMGKIRTDLLRKQGVTDETWDRESVGLVFKGKRLTQS